MNTTFACDPHLNGGYTAEFQIVDKLSNLFVAPFTPGVTEKAVDD